MNHCALASTVVELSLLLPKIYQIRVLLVVSHTILTHFTLATACLLVLSQQSRNYPKLLPPNGAARCWCFSSSVPQPLGATPKSQGQFCIRLLLQCFQMGQLQASLIFLQVLCTAHDAGSCLQLLLLYQSLTESLSRLSRLLRLLHQLL